MRADTTKDDAFPEFIELVDELRELSDEPGTIVVVEGERDERALRGLGIRGAVVLVHQGLRIPELAHELLARGRRVVVLTDWDPEGGHLAQRLKENLAGGRLTVDLEMRRRFARTLRGEVVHVEGLFGWARRSADRLGGVLDEFLAPGGSDRDPTG